MRTPQIQAVVFDKDGTLLDFHQTWDPVIAGMLEELSGGDDEVKSGAASAVRFDLSSGTLADTSPVVAGTNAAVADCLAPWFGSNPGDTAFLAMIEQLFADQVSRSLVQSPGADRLLKKLRSSGIPVGVATNDSEESAHRQFTVLGWADMVDFIIGYDSGYGAKPGPGMIIEGARRLGVEVHELAMVGDSLHDLEAARSAGAVAIYVGPSSLLGESADFHILTIGDLGDIVLAT